MLTYATDLDCMSSPWMLDDTDDLERLIAVASGMVRSATRSARYAVDSAGKPSEDDIIDAFRDATCAQVATWVRAEIDPATECLSDDSGRVASKAMGGRSVSYSATSGAVQAGRQAVAQGLCPEAWTILANAGLVGQQPAVI